MARCFIALGGNLGNVEDTFDRAIRRQGETDAVRVVGRSDIWRSVPVGEQAGGEFRNAAVAVETEVAPLDLLGRLQMVEAELGRTRELHWGPRTLDLDLILYGSETIDGPQLVVPHPAAWYRRFVLDPLAQIAADVVHPVKHVTIGELRERLLARPLPIAVAGGSRSLRSEIIFQLQSQFPAVTVEEWSEINAQTVRDVVLLFWLGSGGEPLLFEDLPRVPRLDASLADAPVRFTVDAVRSALGE